MVNCNLFQHPSFRNATFKKSRPKIFLSPILLSIDRKLLKNLLISFVRNYSHRPAVNKFGSTISTSKLFIVFINFYTKPSIFPFEIRSSFNIYKDMHTSHMILKNLWYFRFKISLSSETHFSSFFFLYRKMILN